jgi:hypothetical protein
MIPLTAKRLDVVRASRMHDQDRRRDDRLHLGPQMATAVLIRAGLTRYKEEFDRSRVGPETYSIHHWAKRW